MQDNIITHNDIYLQDVVCSAVREHGQENDFDLYNRIIEQIDVISLDTVEKILTLIKLNRLALAD